MLTTASPTHFKRYASIAALLWRHGRRDLVEQAGWGDLLGSLSQEQSQARPEQLARDLEERGPTFIKLGQWLSTRADLLPPPYLAALSRLQDGVTPIPFEVVLDVIREELGDESRRFQTIDAEPLAVASLGQVHRAVLTGDIEVAVKVQRPGISKTIEVDLDCLQTMAETLDRNTETGRRFRFGRILTGLRDALQQELDYRIEASNAGQMAELLAGEEGVRVVPVLDDLSTRRVLTMGLLKGRKLTELSSGQLVAIDRAGIADRLMRVYLKQVASEGFFHADPHPGNLLLAPPDDDGRTDVILLDLGMVVPLSPDARTQLTKMILAVGDGRGTDVADVAIRMSREDAHPDPKAFRDEVGRLVARTHGRSIGTLSTGRVLIELQTIAGANGYLLPPEISLLGKTLSHLDQTMSLLDPSLDPAAAIRRHAGQMIRRDAAQKVSLSRAVQAAMTTADLAESLPGRVDRITELLADNRLKLDVDAVDERKLIDGLQKIANRITVGLIVGSLILAAAVILATRDGQWGFDAVLALILFLIAAAGGVRLAARILLSDWK